jgi:hypothetical protein
MSTNEGNSTDPVARIVWEKGKRNKKNKKEIKQTACKKNEGVFLASFYLLCFSFVVVAFVVCCYYYLSRVN